MLNCPNCGAPINPELNKCDYCDTSYFDLSSIDLMNHEPIYLKIRTCINGIPATITQKCIPNLGSIEITTDTSDIIDTRGTVVRKIFNNRTSNTNITFTGIADKDGSLFKLEN